ncbi:response regulator [Anaerovibrio sp.]|uniref:response regulator n=1 Tax=Anaerovibrio sp. TaxID=1872532 RepID=UPI0025C29C85|nr:response regulator [Anaerovibrio sp.]MBR2142858.1 response regulator [Anaerovibrio sp.]
MYTLFAKTLKKLRNDKGISQRELAERIYVTRSTVARWESGSRLPDAVMIFRLSKYLDTDINTLLSAMMESDDAPNIIVVDDKKIFLSGALPILEEVMPEATIMGFSRPSEAIEYAKTNRIALAVLDIEIGKTNGMDLCRTLLSLNPHTNVVYLTAHIEYAFDAWSTGASGYLLKPITQEAVRAQLQNIRYPFSWGKRCRN